MSIKSKCESCDYFSGCNIEGDFYRPVSICEYHDKLVKYNHKCDSFINKEYLLSRIQIISAQSIALIKNNIDCYDLLLKNAEKISKLTKNLEV